jgi:hypothetical protein
VLAVAGVLALTIGVSALVTVVDRTSERRSYTEPRFGWTVDYPEDWRFDETTVAFRYPLLQWTFANFDAASGPVVTHRRPGLIERLEVPDRLLDFPPSGVALRIALFGGPGGPLASSGRSETRFPLRLVDLEPSGGGEVERFASGLVFNWNGADPAKLPTLRAARLAANGWVGFTVGVWVGPEASAEDRRQVSETLESLRFERLRTGQVTRSGFRVMGRTTDFLPGRVASYRAFRDKGPFARGFHLVRDSDGFHTLVDPYECALRLDKSTRMLGCPAVRARWRLNGKSVGSPRQPPLQTLATRVTSDGQVLVQFGGDVRLRRLDG